MLSKFVYSAFTLIFIQLTQLSAYAAVGCTLNNPARDLASLYPEMTSYREDVFELSKLPNGRTIYTNLQERVSGYLDPVYEGFETPYTLYSVFQEDKLIGYVHGVNVPGRGGVIQVFLAVNPKSGEIVRMFFQRLESMGAKSLRSKEFRAQFAGLNLGDFYKHDYFSIKDKNNTADKIANIKSPADLPQAGLSDYESTLRGVRKNLILLDALAFNSQFEPFYQRAKEMLTSDK